MPYILYNIYGSPPCGMVRMLAKHIGVDLELRNVNTFKNEHRTLEYRKINPFQKLPALSDDGFILYESLAICYYLLRKNAPDSELYPNDIKARATIDQALATIVSTIHPHFLKFMRPRIYELKIPTDKDVEEFEENVIKGFEQVLADGNYVLGDRLSLADLCVMAYLSRILEVPFLEAAKYPKLNSYYNRLKAVLPYFDEINQPGIAILRNRWVHVM
ncbi:glutathione S-transferase 1-like [Dermacentor variabilis]|uniref:glutathione S-transferase 1-like n=1 Tax=Dermacentor variabilis TaxID=34621 RepID=UPI003F5C4E66